MTMKPKARKFRLRTSDTPSRPAGEETQRPTPAPEATPTAEKQPAPRSRPQPEPARVTTDTNAAPSPQASTETDLDTIRKEGLTGRQLRMARRIAQKQGLAVTSDFDAVRQLRERGIDPFDRSSILKLITPEAAAGGGGGVVQPPNAAGMAAAGAGGIQLPQTVQQKSRELAEPMGPSAADRRATEILRIQQDIARRRRRKLISLFSRLAAFVLLPTFLAGYYYFVIATPMYATQSSFVIQQSEQVTGLSNLLSGTSMATQADAITVQDYLLSMAAMTRLDEEEGFIAHFSQDWIDPIQRLDQDASNVSAYKLYQRMVTIGYDPTEGTVKMEVIAADPDTSQRFSEALISFTEERVDNISLRMREDQMAGATQYYAETEQRRRDALRELTEIQTRLATLNPDTEIQLIMTQVGALESDRQANILELNSLLAVPRPNEARVNGVKSNIESLDNSIAVLRAQLTEAQGDAGSLASITAELREAEENYQIQIALVQQSFAAVDAARNEADRQVRYLSTSVEPIAPDDPTYPRSFENTLVAMLLFAGLYLMISLTASILREQVSS